MAADRGSRALSADNRGAESSGQPGVKPIILRKRGRVKHSVLCLLLRSAALIPALVLPSFAALSYTCDPGISATVCSYLNSTIAPLYNNTFTNVNAAIYVQYGATGLGESFYGLNFITYSSYRAALTTASQSGNAIQISAVNELNSLDIPLYGNFMVAITSALGRSLDLGSAGVTTSAGFCASPGQGFCYDGIVTVTNGTPLYYRTGTEAYDAYDFYSVVEHETDEILGTASCVATTGTSLANECGSNVLSAVDLFRFQSAGNLVLSSTTPGAYFSYNGGQTNGAGKYQKVYNTLDNGDDYADFLSSTPLCQTQQSIQDAEGCPGFDAGLDITNDGGAEINILNAIGYKLPPPPSITNIQNAATFQTAQALAPGTYLAVFGSNLSTDATGRTWGAADFIQNSSGTYNIPVSLDGTSVTVGGVPGYVYYVSATQLNILTPSTVAPGNNIPVVVTVKGQPGAAFSINLTSLAPSFFAYPEDNGIYLIAQHLDYTDVGRAGLIPNAPANFTTPAKPGETIQLYGTGFGPTSPPIAAGIETDKVYNLRPTPTATVNGTPAAVVFAGLIPPETRIYQVDVTIPPNAPNGDLPLVVTVNGVQSFSGLITVQGP
jgi:uncharacterized protein (TIGR03437 family)